MLVPVLRRIAFAAVLIVGIAFLAFAGLRVLRPSLYPPGEAWLGGALDDLRAGFLHFDFGDACAFPGCPPVSRLWRSGVAADLYLLVGALALGFTAGTLGGVWCAARDGTRRARGVEQVATVMYSSPVAFVALALLLLFNSTFGVLPVPAFFDADPVRAHPWSDPWAWLTTYAVPCAVLAAPIGGMILRMTLTGAREEMDAIYIRTAIAKGLSQLRVVRRHAAPSAHRATISFAGASAPMLVANAIIVEHVFSLPGFLRYAWRATGHSQSPPPPPLDVLPFDFPLLQGVGIWTAALSVVLLLATDVVLAVTDPRVRSGSTRAAI